MILVVGATGMLGGMVTRHLLEKERQVRILVREGSDYHALVEAGAEPAFGDLKDRASLGRAMQGVRTVITTANSAARGGEDNPQTVEMEGNRHLIDAAKDAGVEHFIFTSALGVSTDSPVPFMRGKAMSEEYLKESGLDYTILSPNLFMEIWIGMIVGMPLQMGQPVTIVGEGNRSHTFVSINDVAAYTVAAVDNPAARNQQVFIGGPEAITWTRIVERTARVLGRDVPVHHVAPGAKLPGLPETVSQLAASMDSYDSPLEMGETARAYGVEPTPVEAYLRRTFTTG
ncbi:MAG: SDR family oxidoreductase [Gemmatimonadaceae bacterium]|nr:SDR family oxidoreductase [Gemmatimonadaceae bacterium]